jgi:hypothetical protein
LGYKQTDLGYAHEFRKVIFLGDFIDRGENLAQHKQVLKIVMTMVQNKNALAVMGNHEFNALAYHTHHNGKYRRPHSRKNTKQHQAFLNEFSGKSKNKTAVLEFFYSLPLWLEVDGIRVIHACWDDVHIETMKKICLDNKLNRAALIEATKKGSAAYEAIEVLLKGVEYKLPKGVSFHDQDENHRTAVRIQWWKQNATKLGEIVLPVGFDIGDASRQPVPVNIPIYAGNQPPCFIGHYWLDGEPAPLADNVACLDYSVAKEGKLVAYRWDGEMKLDAEKFTHAKR